MSRGSSKPRIGISVGDINGVGLEVIIKTFIDSRMQDFCVPIVYGSSKLSTAYRKVLEINDFSFNVIKSADEANAKKANIMECWQEEVELKLGESNQDGGTYALRSLEAATNDLKAGKIDALVTAPINKENIQSDQFNFPGHTEYLDENFEGKSLMLMVNDTIKIGVATNHIPVSSIANTLTADMIFTKLKILNKSLTQDFCINGPRIAVLGLNPHAGDNGLLGKEEENMIIPAINNAKSIGINAFGPYPADGFFGSGAFTKFDAVLAMYHDQGLIPFKSLSFGEGVNYTAGLSIIRTSPDHGVAYDIAGQNKADENSFRKAVYLACDIVKHRRLSEEINENPLVVKK
ncbi:MAG: 4-hydroxythreonine-4-phosphate dehydrogenase PdxA [Flavobacteriales bacterium]|nr:4-hydroxythreonine-4-phosphate dehydrogenase PdxA [Flavobacteriales bacterium]